MLDSTFRHLFKLEGAVTIGKYTLWYKSLNLWNEETGEEIHFKTYDDAMNHVINGKSIRDIVAEADIHLFDLMLTGGSGNSSSSKTFKFGSASGGEPAQYNPDLPARMNTKIKVKTEQEAIKAFREMHGKSDIEHSISVDVNGFVSGYAHGDKNSVISPIAKKGETIVHNHPKRSYGKESHFSDADLINTAKSNTRAGIVATFEGGYHNFRKGTHFKAESFAKAVKTADLKGSNYDDAVTKWLRRNQKKYGYKYTLHLDNKAKTPVPKIKFDASGQGSLF